MEMKIRQLKYHKLFQKCVPAFILQLDLFKTFQIKIFFFLHKPSFVVE